MLSRTPKANTINAAIYLQEELKKLESIEVCDWGLLYDEITIVHLAIRKILRRAEKK